VQKLALPFYLTGGTALSRHYFAHRYSDDLDLFVNKDPDFDAHVADIFAALEVEQDKMNFRIRHESVQKFDSFATLHLISLDGKTDLKIDLVNDVAAHYGGFEASAVLGKVDHWRNILSNKIGALLRFEPKDYADLWVIARHCSFSWKEVIEEAKTKEAGLDPVVLYDLIRSFPPEMLPTIRWAVEVNTEAFLKDLHRLAEDLFLMRINVPEK
jgi:predicted nucleotidyltransferase component of viral defense system